MAYNYKVVSIDIPLGEAIALKHRIVWVLHYDLVPHSHHRITAVVLDPD